MDFIYFEIVIFWFYKNSLRQLRDFLAAVAKLISGIATSVMTGVNQNDFVMSNLQLCLLFRIQTLIP